MDEDPHALKGVLTIQTAQRFVKGNEQMRVASG